MIPIADTQFVEATWIMVVKSIVIFAVIFGIVPVMTVVERKLIGRFQHRYGPNRVGPFGLLQPLADLFKLISKQGFRPANAIPMLYVLGPLLPVLSGVMALAIIPWGNVQDGVGLYGIDVPIGILYFFAVGSIAFYGLLLGGWSSGSKYSLLGAMRGAAQLISYEVSMGLALLGVIMMGGSLSLVDIVEAQGEIWFIVPQFVGFLIFMLAGFAETNRTPFDMPEADAELVQGFMTEYGGMRFGSFLMVEYLEIIVVCGVAAAMFLGGWMGPGPGFLDPIWMLLKIFGLVFFFIWVRATLPRLRYDQLMSLGWKVLLPLATLNVLVTAVLVVVDMSERIPLPRTDQDVVEVQRGPEPGRGRRRLPRLRRDPARPEDDDGAPDRGADDDPVPGGEDAGLPALPRPPQTPQVRGHRPREVRRLLALRRRLPGRLHPRRRRREHPRRAGLGRRALRRGLRDQPLALHLLRLLRDRLPLRRDHDGPRLRDGRLRPRRT